MAIVDVRDISVLETDSGSTTATFTLFLDQLATAPVTVRYFYQGGTAAEASGDFNEFGSQITIPAGTNSITVSTSVSADNLVEGNEFFDLYVIAGLNAELPDGAAALRARATIFDDDDAVFDPPVGEGNLAERVMGPNGQAGLFPTVDVRNVALIEGDSSSDPARFLISLDRPATAPVTLQYYLQGIEAAETKGDFNEFASSIQIPAGAQSTWLDVAVNGDNLIEGDETFDLIIWDAVNAIFPQGSVALKATATILDDDDAGGSTLGGIGGFSEKLEGPRSGSETLPTISVASVSVIEGDVSTDPARFLVTLDQPAPTDVSFNYRFENGSAVSVLGDYNQFTQTLTIQEGKQAAVISTTISGDDLIEGDEEFSLILTRAQNAVFAGGAPILKATGRIIDDDGGVISDSAGSKLAATQVFGPEDVPGTQVVIEVVETSIIEGNFSSDPVGLYFVLSKPAPTDLSIQYQTFSRSATAGQDFSNVTRTFVIPAGQSSWDIPLTILGDTAIEGEEFFDVRLTVLSGDAVFENGAINTDVPVTIFDNDDGVLSPGEDNPRALFSNTRNGQIGSDGDDTLVGTAGNDEIIALQGDDSIDAGDGNDDIFGDGGFDTIIGGSGDDFLRGGREADLIRGGDGNDILRGQREGDTLEGGAGDDNLKAGGGNDSLDGGAGDDFLKGGTRRDTIDGGSGEDRLFGNSFDDILNGDGGNDVLNGGGDDDTLDGGAGDDTIKGGSGADTFIFAEGNDRFLDFDTAEDILQLEQSLLDGQSLSAYFDSTAVAVSGNNTVLDFSGDTLTLLGVTNLGDLKDATELF